MTSIELFGLLALLAGFCYLIVKDKKLDGMLVFYVGNAVLIVMGIVWMIYLAAKNWL